MIFRTAKYPQRWTLCFLKQVHKKDALDDPDNYRGIDISSCRSKLYSIILLNRLTEEANKRQLISVNQIGFQKGKRTTNQIFVLQTLIDKIVKHEKQKLFVAFIDFRKAYGLCSRPGQRVESGLRWFKPGQRCTNVKPGQPPVNQGSQGQLVWLSK